MGNIAEIIVEFIAEIRANNIAGITAIILAGSDQNLSFYVDAQNLNIGPSVANRIRIIMATRGASDRNLSF